MLLRNIMTLKSLVILHNQYLNLLTSNNKLSKHNIQLPSEMLACIHANISKEDQMLVKSGIN